MEELATLGVFTSLKEGLGGVLAEASYEDALNACLWSRTASRVLLRLAMVPAEDSDTLYEALLAIEWEEHLSPDATLAVDFRGSGPGFHNLMFAAQRVKDAVVDRLRARTGRRPSVDRQHPDLRILVRLAGVQALVTLDLSGEPLHRRSYRLAGHPAPLRENLAAALLWKAGWPALLADNRPFIDPLCGSGTLVIEAALMAWDWAPGLLRRDRWGFEGWLGHVPLAWRRVLQAAQDRQAAGASRRISLAGFDHDGDAIRLALAQTERAGLAGRVHFERREMADSRPPAGSPGLLMANPPYGERLQEGDLAPLYESLGDLLKERFVGWRAALLTANPELGKRMGLRAHQVNRFHNGPILCQFLQFRVEPEAGVDRAALDVRAGERVLASALARGGEDFLNRLKKNLKTLDRWAAREGISCYRVYDADLPDFAVAIDRYGDWAQVQEYRPPASVDPQRAADRLGQVMTLTPLALGLPAQRVVLKIRERQRGTWQYQRQDDRDERIEIQEGAARFLVNLTDYLDTGLFLDHRLVRERLKVLAHGRDFLNLFCYTGTATVQAALGGARSTTSVDLSATYLRWTADHLALNGLNSSRHPLIQADARIWPAACRARFDLILLDPPSFSNSKRMADTLDIQRDHVPLIQDAANCLTPEGILIFSSPLRRFKLDTAALEGLQIRDISQDTLPRDFERHPGNRHVYEIRQRVSA